MPPSPRASSRPAEVDSDESDSTGRVGHGDSGDSVGSVGSKRDRGGANGRAGDEDRSSADKLERGSPVDDTDMDLDDDDDDEPPSFDWSKTPGGAAGEGEGASGVGSRMANPPPEVMVLERLGLVMCTYCILVRVPNLVVAVHRADLIDSIARRFRVTRTAIKFAVASKHWAHQTGMHKHAEVLVV